MLESLSLLGACSSAGSLLSDAECTKIDTTGYVNIGPVLSSGQCEEMKLRLEGQLAEEGAEAGTELLHKQIENLVKQGADREQVLSQEQGVQTLCLHASAECLQT